MELVKSNLSKLKDDRKLMKRWSLSFHLKEGYASYSLPHSKTDSGFSGSPVVIPARKECEVKHVLCSYYYAIHPSETVPNQPFPPTTLQWFHPD